jgi:hypothetical protein
MGSKEVYKNGVCQHEDILLFYVVLCPASSGSQSAHYFGYKQRLFVISISFLKYIQALMEKCGIFLPQVL